MFSFVKSCSIKMKSNCQLSSLVISYLNGICVILQACLSLIRIQLSLTFYLSSFIVTKVTRFSRVTFSYAAVQLPFDINFPWSLDYIRNQCSGLPGETISLSGLCAANIWCPGISNLHQFTSWSSAFFLLGLTYHQHCSGYMATFQFTGGGRPQVGAPLCIISGTSGNLASSHKRIK